MSLTIFGAPLSPFVRKVRLFAAEKGLDYQLENVNPFNQPEWYREINPLGRIPAICDGDFTLADSGVICQYLEERSPSSPCLLGATVQSRAQVRWLEKYADYELAPLATFAVFGNRLLKPIMGKPCDEGAVWEALQYKLPGHFDYLEKYLGSRDYLVDNAFSLADIAFVSQMVNMRYGGEELDAQRWPGLRALVERICSRPCLTTILQGEQQFIAKITQKKD